MVLHFINIICAVYETAHRGAGTAAPENTLVAIEYSQQYGYNAIEFDVMLSKDNKTFLMHDEERGRTVEGTGSCSQYTLEELTSLDACKWHTGDRGDFSKCLQSRLVPQYQQVLDYCRQYGIWMNVEVKPCEGHEDATGAEVARLTKNSFAKELALLAVQLAEFQYAEIFKTVSNLPLISSFSYTSLLAVAREAPMLPRAYLIHNLAEVPEWRKQMVEIRAIAVHTSVEFLTEEQAREIKRLGYGLFVYTVNSLEDRDRLLGWGVDSFCTDEIELFQKDARLVCT